MISNKENEFYNQCYIIVEIILNNKKAGAFEWIIGNEKILKIIKDIDQSLIKKPTFNKHLIASIFSPYLSHHEYSLEAWNKFELEYYPLLRKNFPKIFTSKSIKGIRGDLLESVLLFVINFIFNINNIFGYSVNSKADSLKLMTMGDFAPLLSREKEKLILEKLQNQFKISGIPVKEIWGDNDILIISKRESVDCFAIISCKSSLRERAFQSAFWAMRSRLEGKHKHVFCTLDIGNSKGKTEIGKRDKNNTARKNRDVLESIMDRTYVFRDEIEVPRSPAIKSLNYLKIDLRRWEADFWGL